MVMIARIIMLKWPSYLTAHGFEPQGNGRDDDSCLSRYGRKQAIEELKISRFLSL